MDWGQLFHFDPVLSINADVDTMNFPYKYIKMRICPAQYLYIAPGPSFTLQFPFCPFLLANQPNPTRYWPRPCPWLPWAYNFNLFDEVNKPDGRYGNWSLNNNTMFNLRSM